jgi:hypothetical protein
VTPHDSVRLSGQAGPNRAICWRFTNLEIGLGGAVDVMANTPVRMGRELPTLVEHSTRQDPMTAVAAEMVREARRSATANKE